MEGVSAMPSGRQGPDVVGMSSPMFGVPEVTHWQAPGARHPGGSDEQDTALSSWCSPSSGETDVQMASGETLEQRALGRRHSPVPEIVSGSQERLPGRP